MKLSITIKTAVAALLFMAGLQTTHAQGVKVYKNDGTVIDVPAALLDRIAVYKSGAPTPILPDYPDNPDIPVPGPGPNPDDEPIIKVEPFDISSLGAALGFVATLQQAGMPLHIGTTPPTVNGVFSMKSIGVVAQWAADPENQEFEQLDKSDELVVKFSKQSGNNVWINLYDVDKSGAGMAFGDEYDMTDVDGFKSYIIGSGNKFTAAFRYSIDWGSNYYFNMVYIFSGEVSGNTLKDFYVAVVSLDRDSKSVEEYGIGKDADGTSTTTTWAPGSYSKARSLKAPLKAARKLAEGSGKGVTVYRTDGTSFNVSRAELDHIETYEASFDNLITQQIPQEYLEKMSTYMPIYSGNTPPTANGTYRVSKQTLVYDAGGSFRPGKTVVDMIMDYSNQSKTDNTLDFQCKEIGSDGSVISQTNKTQMVVMGSGNNFTAFAVTEGQSKGVYNKMATIVSGTVTATGLSNYYLGVLMLDKGDDSAPGKRLIDVGVFRIFNDGDGMAVKDSWSARRKAPQNSSDSAPCIMDMPE